MSRYLYPFERRLIWENRRRWAIVVLIVYVILFLLDRWIFHGLYVGHGLHPLDAEAARTRLESRQWAMMLKGMGYLPLWLGAALALGLARMADAGWRIAGAAALSGGLAEILKPIVGRVRPHFTDGVHVLRHVPGVPDEQISYSMSSSHAGVAFGAAFMVLFLWGAPGWVALVLALGCGVERMMAGAHFFTDIYVAAVIGYVVARLMQPGGWTGRKPGIVLP